MDSWNWTAISTIIDFLGLVFVAITLLFTKKSIDFAKKSVDAEKKAELADCIAEYNFNFLESKELGKVERILESCYARYRELKKEAEIKHAQIDTENLENEFLKIFEEARIITMVKDETGTEKYDRSKEKKQPDCLSQEHQSEDKKHSDCLSQEYQSIVNYLVYLEGFSALINQEIVDIKDVDDLFGYRFFIAMNNPVIQEFELRAYKPYYRGCYSAYKKWSKYRNDNKIAIPFENLFSLENEN